MRDIPFSALVGKTLTAIEGATKQSGEIKFTCSDGTQYRMLHFQDCCECVDVEDIVGDIADLLNTPILIAEEAINPPEVERIYAPRGSDSETYTFYKLATIKGYIDIRWYGSSNGYYGESVDFCEVTE